MHAAYQGGYRAGLSVAHGSHVMVQCENGAANTIPPVQMDCALGKLTPQIISCSFSTSRKSREDDERANFITDEGNLTSSMEESECGPPSKELAMLIYKNEDVAEVTEASTDDHEHEHEVEESYPSGTEISFNCITSISGERTTWKIICEDGHWIGRAHDCGKFYLHHQFNIPIKLSILKVMTKDCTTLRWRTVRASSRTRTRTWSASTTIWKSEKTMLSFRRRLRSSQGKLAYCFLIILRTNCDADIVW